MVTTTQDMSRGALNTETQKILNYVQGYRTEKEVIKEFFGLREEVVFEDDGVNIKEYLSDFGNHEVLKQKKVKYNDKIAERGVTKEVFDKMFTNGLPTLETKQVQDEGATGEGTTTSTTAKKPANRKPRTTKKK